jgi:hypothetical protein
MVASLFVPTKKRWTLLLGLRSPFKGGLSRLAVQGPVQTMTMKWDTDRIVSLSAMLVGLGSLFIVLYQTTLMREQSERRCCRISDLLSIRATTASYIALRNVGLGPRLIDEFSHLSLKRSTATPYAYYASLGTPRCPEQRLPRPGPAGMLIPAGSNPAKMLGSVDPSQMAPSSCARSSSSR